MKHINYFLSLLFLISNTSFCVIGELSQFQQSLQKIPPFLSATKPVAPVIPPPLDPAKKPETPVKKPEITTYEELKTAVDAAYKAKDPSLLENNYVQTRNVVTAYHLLKEVLKEDKTLPKYQRHYIPFIAQITQEMERTYKTSLSTPLYIVYLDEVNMSRDLLLGNELLLMQALRWTSFNFHNIRLIPMNLWYDSDTKEYLKKTFNNWCNAHSIPLATSASGNGVALELYDDVYAYIKNVMDGTLPKNHLFIMIRSFNDEELKVKQTELTAVINILYDFSGDRFLNPINELQFQIPGESNFNIYVPYNKQFFLELKNITPAPEKITELRTEARDIILGTHALHKDMITSLSNKFFSLLNPEYVNIIKNVDLLFYDLIKNTKTQTPLTPLAFRSVQADPEMTEITRIEGTMEEIYNRYNRYKR